MNLILTTMLSDAPPRVLDVKSEQDRRVTGAASLDQVIVTKESLHPLIIRKPFFFRPIIRDRLMADGGSAFGSRVDHPHFLLIVVAAKREIGIEQRRRVLEKWTV